VTNVGGGIAGYSGTITGLTNLINNNSIGGSPSARWARASMPAASPARRPRAPPCSTASSPTTATGGTTVFVNSAALSGSSDGLRINTTGAFGTSLAPNTISVKNDTAAAGAAMNGYETLDINTGGTTLLRLAD
jgi:hypothetical protein